MGDFVIVTFEGDDLLASFIKFCQSKDPFAQWFIKEVKEVHGMDMSQPLTGPMPELVVDSY
ncbi:MAG: hypothetical protein EPN82_08845 [Bacteroidetes bacterium]|nr:MAG: hypothetical protein EPN82_08845 [Bacteroidota bacterium]